MKRRALLAGTTLTGAGFAGCLSSDFLSNDDTSSDGSPDTRPENDSGQDDGTDHVDDGNGVGDIEFERCGNRIVGISELPFHETLDEEVQTALEDGEYETDGDLVLPKLIDIRDSYLKNDGTYYAAEVEEDGNVSRLYLEETMPTIRDLVSVSNVSERGVEVAVRIVYENEEEVVVDEAVKLEASESIRFNLDRYGIYQIEVTATSNGSEENVEKTWVNDEGGCCLRFDLSGATSESDDLIADTSYSAAERPPQCKWDSFSGELLQGSDA